MIRKAIIVVLTVAAVLTGVSPILTTERRPRLSLLRIRGNPRFGIGFQHPFKLEANYVYQRPLSAITDTFYHKRRLGFEIVVADSHVEYPNTGKVWAEFAVRIDVPIWCPCALFAAYPAIAFIRGPVRRYRRRKRCCCLKCGYNLTGNVSGVCPECGAAVRER
jgi:hypothetical protein